MPTSEAQKLAMKRYYEKNRDTRIAQMRDAYRVREAHHRLYLAEHPEALEEVREKGREKYHQGVERRNRVIIGGWLSDPALSPTFKEFLRHNVLPVVGNGLPKQFLDMCWEHLAIATAENPPNETPAVEVDASAHAELVGTGQGR